MLRMSFMIWLPLHNLMILWKLSVNVIDPRSMILQDLIRRCSVLDLPLVLELADVANFSGNRRDT
jgi:hypothetical protein